MSERAGSVRGGEGGGKGFYSERGGGGGQMGSGLRGFWTFCPALALLCIRWRPNEHTVNKTIEMHRGVHSIQYMKRREYSV